MGMIYSGNNDLFGGEHEVYNPSNFWGAPFSDKPTSRNWRSEQFFDSRDELIIRWLLLVHRYGSNHIMPFFIGNEHPLTSFCCENQGIPDFELYSHTHINHFKFSSLDACCFLPCVVTMCHHVSPGLLPKDTHFGWSVRGPIANLATGCWERPSCRFWGCGSESLRWDTNWDQGPEWQILTDWISSTTNE